ncbi:hypothetical protein CLCR_05173 [Cladophialophora carrionii]|uniref:Uncharacterized protein n=1 Tax=Cladophialophora carrionii TaxID=86049 RepID=A0A1C1CKQ6_9EURO|nr:hypothetical protein CLCR_05173 [Cladophialophora carrionii]
MSSDPWPMIAGVGAGIAAAAAVGQMIVAAVTLGQQNAGQTHTDEEISAIKRDLEEMQRVLREHGLDAARSGGGGGGNLSSSDEQARQARVRANRIKSVDELKDMEKALQAKVRTLVEENKPRGREPQDKTWFTRIVEQRGRDFMGIR